MLFRLHFVSSQLFLIRFLTCFHFRCSCCWLDSACSCWSSLCSSWVFCSSAVHLWLPWGVRPGNTAQSAVRDVVSESKPLHHSEIRVPQCRDIPWALIPGPRQVLWADGEQKLLSDDIWFEVSRQRHVRVPVHHRPPEGQATRTERGESTGYTSDTK